MHKMGVKTCSIMDVGGFMFVSSFNAYPSVYNLLK